MKEFHIKLSEPEIPQGPYQAEILRSPAGTEGFDFPDNPICQLTLPDPLPSGRKLQDFQKYLLNLEQQEANELQLIGMYLFNFLFGPPNKRNMLYDYWKKCYTSASEQMSTDAMSGMRTILHLTSPMLVGVPWELCHDNGDYLVLLPLPPHALIRSGWEATGLNPLPPVPLPQPPNVEPLRVLLTICHSKDDSPLMGPQEALDVDMALFDQLPWTVDLHIMVRPSLQEMQAHCSQWEPHILHFVGHGGTSNGQPYLLCYEGEETQGKQLFPGDLIYLFKRTVPRLIVLNACRSGQGQAPPTSDERLVVANAIYNFSQRLINKGVLAVIAMQADIKGKDAVALMWQFYSQLAQGYPIDRALSLARHKSHASDLQSQSNWSWILPTLCLANNVSVEDVLMLHNDDECKNEPLVLPPHSVLDKYDNLPLSMSVKIHVGREEDELQLAKQVLEPGSSPITLIHGIEDVGKSTVLYWLAECCARRGVHFIYADFGRKALGYWDVLRLIRDGRLGTGEGIQLNNHLQPNVIFNTFNYTLNCKCIPDYALNHPQKPDPADEVGDEAPAGNLTKMLEQVGTSRAEEDPVETITDAFIAGLKRAAGCKGLIIFLDHIEKMAPEVLKTMQKYLLGKIPKVAGNSIRLVLAVQDPAFPAPFRPPTSNLSWEEVSQLVQTNESKVFERPLRVFSPEEALWFARIWARRYFLSCKHEKFLIILQQMQMLLNAPVQLGPEDVDAYVQDRIRYKWPFVLPKRFIGDLLKEENIRDLLFALQGRA